MKNITICIINLLMLSACDVDRADKLNQELQQTRSELEEANNKLEEVRNRTEELGSAINTLRENVDDFDDDNWRDNVPKVKEATTNVETSLSELESVVN